MDGVVFLYDQLQYIYIYIYTLCSKHIKQMPQLRPCLQAVRQLLQEDAFCASSADGTDTEGGVAEGHGEKKFWSPK